MKRSGYVGQKPVYGHNGERLGHQGETGLRVGRAVEEQRKRRGDLRRYMNRRWREMKAAYQQEHPE